MLAVRREGDRVSFTVRVTPWASANAVAGVPHGAAAALEGLTK